MLNICSVRPAAYTIPLVYRVRSTGKAPTRIHTFESQNLLLGVHNRGVGGDWSTENIIGIVQVDNNDLVLFVDFLPHTDEMVGFEGQCLCSGVNRPL